MIEFQCPKCSRQFKLGDGKAGKRGKCPDCGEILLIPHLPSQRPASAAPAAPADTPTAPSPSADVQPRQGARLAPESSAPSPASPAAADTKANRPVVKIALIAGAAMVVLGGLAVWLFMGSGEPGVSVSAPFKQGQIELSTTVLWTSTDRIEKLAISPDLTRVACYYVSDDKVYPFIAGEDGDPGDTLPPLWTKPPAGRGGGSYPEGQVKCIFSENSKHYVFIFYPTGYDELRLSGDSDAVRSYVQWDGRAGKKYAAVDSVGISPDGKHVSYLASDPARGWLAVFDEKEVVLAKRVSASASSPGRGTGSRMRSPRPRAYFSPDRTRLIHALRSNLNGRWSDQVHVDNTPAGTYRQLNDVKWSKDSTRYAYFVQSETEGGYSPLTIAGVVDGKRLKAYSHLRGNTFVFSDDATQYAFVASGDKWAQRHAVTGGMYWDQFVVRVLADGKHVEGKHYVAISEMKEAAGPGRELEFARDGCLTYTAAILDAKDSKSPTRRFDSRPMIRAHRLVQVVNEQEREYQGDMRYPPRYSADGKHSVCIKRIRSADDAATMRPRDNSFILARKAPHALVHDGQVGRTFEGWLGMARISPDGGHVAAWHLPKSGSYNASPFLVVDDAMLPSGQEDSVSAFVYVNATTLRAVIEPEHRSSSGQKTLLLELKLVPPKPKGGSSGDT